MSNNQSENENTINFLLKKIEENEKQIKELREMLEKHMYENEISDIFVSDRIDRIADDIWSVKKSLNNY